MTFPGSPSPGGWHGRVWRLAWPVVLSNLTVPLVGAVDTAVVGHLDSPHYIGGVALGTLIFNYLYWGFGFLRMGTTGLVAQARGAGDVPAIQAALARALLLAVAFGFACLLLALPIADLAFALLDGSPESEAAGRDYFLVRVFAAPAALCNISALGFFYGMQAMRAGFLQQVAINVLNVALSLYFVVALDWGVKGVALGTAIAQYAGLALGAWLILRLMPRTGRRLTLAQILDRARLKAMMAVNRDLFIRTLAVLTATAFFMNSSAALGDTALAANALLWVMLTFAAYGLDGYAHAAEALVGEGVGARSAMRVRRSVVAAAIGAGVLALAMAIGLAAGGGLAIDLLTTLPEVRGEARAYMLWAAAVPLVSVWSFLLDGVFIGATRGPEMRNSMVFSLALFMGTGWLAMQVLGNSGLWASYLLFMLVRTATLLAYYPRIERDAEAGR